MINHATSLKLFYSIVDENFRRQKNNNKTTPKPKQQQTAFIVTIYRINTRVKNR